MSEKTRLTLMPRGIVIEAEKGAPLKDLLFPHGVEFPCGGRGLCKRCKVRVLKGELPVTEGDASLERAELETGIRRACAHTLESDLTLEVIHWETVVLTDDTKFDFEPGKGLGIAIDLGTTTLAGQLLNLERGQVLAVQTALNPQAKHGADVMSRISFAVLDGGQKKLEDLIRRELYTLIKKLLQAAPKGRQLSRVVIAGNTPMHNLFCGINIAPLAYYPFTPEFDDLRLFQPAELGWELPGNPEISFLPGLGSFVGSDILAGMLATGFHRSEKLNVFVDLGTNGEIVVGNRDRLLCASAAAGPAFEAARISMGMQATTGAINEVTVVDGKLSCSVLGAGEPRGICGSGLVDAVASLLDLGLVQSSGRFSNDVDEIELRQPVTLTQQDVRELQLAKGAIATGIRLLLEQWGATEDEVQQVYLAGAFGNYVRFASAARIGLFRFPREKIRPAGNTALLGAKLALFSAGAKNKLYQAIRSLAEHVSLNTDPKFQDYYVDELVFPA